MKSYRVNITCSKCGVIMGGFSTNLKDVKAPKGVCVKCDKEPKLTWDNCEQIKLL